MTRFGKLLTLWRNFKRLWPFLDGSLSIWQNLNPLWKMWMLLGKFSLLQKAQYWKNNPTIWSRCWLLSLNLQKRQLETIWTEFKFFSPSIIIQKNHSLKKRTRMGTTSVEGIIKIDSFLNCVKYYFFQKTVYLKARTRCTYICPIAKNNLLWI